MFRERPLFSDDAPAASYLEQILCLGRDNGLTAYDAAYLELVMRTGLPLATLDDRLRQAAKAAGLPDLPKENKKDRDAFETALDT